MTRAKTPKAELKPQDAESEATRHWFPAVTSPTGGVVTCACGWQSMPQPDHESVQDEKRRHWRALGLLRDDVTEAA